MNFKQESLIKNFLAFVKPLSDQEIVDLHQFMLEDYDDKVPTELQKSFIDDFIGFKEWGEYIMHVRSVKANPNHMWSPMLIVENVTNLRNFLGHEAGLRYRKHLNKSHSGEKREDSFKTKLKKELKNAVENSYFDGVFDKCDGWCNVADVLVDHGLITLSDD